MARANDTWLLIVGALFCVAMVVVAGFVWVYVLGFPGPHTLACGLVYGYPSVWRAMRCP